MKLKITDAEGLIQLGALSLVWGNPVADLEGFFCIGLNDRFIEFGEIDNGRGIHYSRYEDGDLAVSQTLLRLS